VGGLPELIEDGGCGALVAAEPETALPGRMAAVLARWAADPAETRRLGENAARRAREVFSPAHFARGVAEVYREMLDPRGSAR
jgi:glycosyltransferase involved in cell wall biosynthesis